MVLSMNRRCLVWTILVVALLVVPGCGGDAPDLAAAGGSVVHDGAPLAGANVVFVPEAGGPAAVGMTGTDGKFQLTTGGQAGAALGKHKVAISAEEESSQGSSTVQGGEFIGQRKSRIPVSYSNHEMSGLSAEVTADGENNFTFELSGSP